MVIITFCAQLNIVQTNAYEYSEQNILLTYELYKSSVVLVRKNNRV